MALTASNLVQSISSLPRNRVYNYINTRNNGLIRIVRVVQREGPIVFKRWDPTKDESEISAKEESISSQLIWRVANSIQRNVPINIDRVLGASYNTRSVLESLLAYTSQFYVTHPGRIETIGQQTKVKRGHKHIIWLPEQPHEQGAIYEHESNQVISEIPSQQAIYESIVLPESVNGDGEVTFDIEMQRRHSQIQIALVKIGLQLGYRTWVAQNDRGIIYQGRRIAEMEGVISSLHDEQLLSSFNDAIRAALLIDCIWFKNGRLMPAVLEVEYTTGITSGLTRMKNFQDEFPPFRTRYVIVAPDDDRQHFERLASREQFLSLNAMFFSFSAVEELYSLCQRRRINGVTEDFLDCYMERVT